MMRLFIIFILSSGCYPLIAQENCAPFSESATRLFYIQRTGNSDTIVYDANTANNGQFQKNNPVIIYWKRSDKNGQKEGLNYLQRTRAYGIKHHPSGHANEYLFHLIAYPQRNFLLKNDDCGHPAVLLTLAGKEAYVKRIFIALEPTRFGLIPTIYYIEIFGVDVQTGEAAYEKLKP